MKTVWRFLSMVTVLLGLTCLCGANGQVDRDAQHDADTARASSLGKQLRRDIDQRYEQLVSTRALKTNGAGRNFINDVFTPYLSPGMHVSEAEAILRAAGFVLRRWGTPIGSRRGPVDLFAIDPYRTQLFASKTTVNVLVYPDDPEVWKTLQQYEAEIVVDFL